MHFRFRRKTAWRRRFFDLKIGYKTYFIFYLQVSGGEIAPA